VVRCNVAKRGWITGVGPGLPKNVAASCIRLHDDPLPGQVHAVPRGARTGAGGGRGVKARRAYTCAVQPWRVAEKLPTSYPW